MLCQQTVKAILKSNIWDLSVILRSSNTEASFISIQSFFSLQILVKKTKKKTTQGNVHVCVPAQAAMWKQHNCRLQQTLKALQMDKCCVFIMYFVCPYSFEAFFALLIIIKTSKLSATFSVFGDLNQARWSEQCKPEAVNTQRSETHAGCLRPSSGDWTWFRSENILNETLLLDTDLIPWSIFQDSFVAKIFIKILLLQPLDWFIHNNRENTNISTTWGFLSEHVTAVHFSDMKMK